MSLHGNEPWPLDKAHAALLVIDMQSDFVDEGAVMEVAMARHRIPVMRQVIDLCRAHGVPVIYTQHVLSDHFDISPLETAYQPRLKAKGMPVLRSRDVGDLYIQVVVETPQNLTKRQRELLAEFDAESSSKTHPESAGFFAKMRDLFDNLSGS